MENETTDIRQAESIWIRGLFMLLFAVFYSVAEVVLAAVVIVQFGFHLFSGKSHPRLLGLGAAIASYVYQVLRYLTFNSEVKPFPFSEWPLGEAADDTIEGELINHEDQPPP